MPLYFQLLSALFSSLSHFVLKKIKRITYISEFGAFLFIVVCKSAMSVDAYSISHEIKNTLFYLIKNTPIGTQTIKYMLQCA